MTQKQKPIELHYFVWSLIISVNSVYLNLCNELKELDNNTTKNILTNQPPHKVATWKKTLFSLQQMQMQMNIDGFDSQY